jgi:hypothetical protein
MWVLRTSGFTEPLPIILNFLKNQPAPEIAENKQKKSCHMFMKMV